MSSIFMRIIRGEIPCHKILEDDHYLAFLDLKPVRPGHTLVIPKKEVDYFFDLDDETMNGLMVFSKKVAKAIREAVPCAKIGVVVAGLEVRHVHVHLIPIDAVADLNFANAKPMFEDQLISIAKQIQEYL